MIQHWIHQAGSDKLLLLFAGWGMDAHPFQELCPEDADLCLCYDYTDMAFDASLLKPYCEIEVWGWSMGVWAATVTLGSLSLPWGACRAINGTPYPIDAERGIAPAIFAATLQNITQEGMNRFNRRMCGNNRELLAQFSAVAPHRTLESLYEELAAIERHATNTPLPPFYWHSALIGAKDRIFPPSQQCAAWGEETQIILTEDAHYLPFSRLIHER